MFCWILMYILFVFWSDFHWWYIPLFFSESSSREAKFCPIFCRSLYNSLKTISRATSDHYNNQKIILSVSLTNIARSKIKDTSHSETPARDGVVLFGPTWVFNLLIWWLLWRRRPLIFLTTLVQVPKWRKHQLRVFMCVRAADMDIAGQPLIRVPWLQKMQIGHAFF